MSGPNNPAAFPFDEKSGDGTHWHSHSGMGLRDWFAGQALVGLLASGVWSNIGDGFENFIADHANNIADAMLAERDKVQP